jgi:hypothetical protein
MKTKIEFTKDKSINDMLKVHCVDCKKDTNHEVKASLDLRGSEDCGHGNSFDWYDVYQIIRCKGCDFVSFRKVHSNSEDLDAVPDGKGDWDQIYAEKEDFYPSPESRTQIKEYVMLPPLLQGIYHETIKAINSNSQILAGIGIRAIIEAVCKDQGTSGNLEKKINLLSDKGLLTKDGASILHQLRVLGNAAAHEVKPHSLGQLSVALDVIDHLLVGVYVLPIKAKETL